MERESNCQQCDWFIAGKGCCHAFSPLRERHIPEASCLYWQGRSDWSQLMRNKKMLVDTGVEHLTATEELKS
jgi:hypothetical protein